MDLITSTRKKKLKNTMYPHDSKYNEYYKISYSLTDSHIFSPFTLQVSNIMVSCAFFVCVKGFCYVIQVDFEVSM